MVKHARVQIPPCWQFQQNASHFRMTNESTWHLVKKTFPITAKCANFIICTMHPSTKNREPSSDNARKPYVCRRGILHGTRTEMHGNWRNLYRKSEKHVCKQFRNRGCSFSESPTSDTEIQPDKGKVNTRAIPILSKATELMSKQIGFWSRELRSEKISG